MQINTYQLTIFRQNRILSCFLLVPLVLFVFILPASTVEGGVVLALLIAGLFLVLGYYYIQGGLTVIRYPDRLEFEWEQKPFFNFKPIAPVAVEDIHSIEVDQGCLKKIRTADRVISIETAKIKQKDSHKLFYELQSINPKTPVATLGSWDVWQEKGYPKIAYGFTITLLFIGAIAVGVFIYQKGFSHRLFLLLGMVPFLLDQLGRMKASMNRRPKAQ